MSIDTIVMPTDGSEPARGARPVAADIARGLGARVVVVAVVEPENFGGAPDQNLVDSMEEYLRGVVAEDVAWLADQGVESVGRVTCGPRVWQSVLDVAQESHAGLVVIGSHGRTGLARTALGSVADQVVRHARVPVTVVPQQASDPG